MGPDVQPSIGNMLTQEGDADNGPLGKTTLQGATMPDGRVQRIDEKRQLAYIVRKGRTYSAPLAEVDSKARVPSAMVRFDLLRTSGSESATNVRLQAGTRTNRRHRRFADLIGARRPGAKVDTIASRSFGVDVTTQPFRVVKAWLEAMSEQDYDGATSLYLPGADLHTGTSSVSGRRHVRTELELCELTGADIETAKTSGVDRYVKVECTSGDTQHVAYFVIERGQIVEQWIDVEPEYPDSDDSTSSSEVVSIQLVSRGDVSQAASDHAEERLRHLIDHVNRPVRFARIKLTMAENPTVQSPAMVEATLEFDKLLVRAHSTAPTFAEASDQMAKRLAAQIENHRDRQRHRPDRLEPAPGEWRHRNLPRSKTPYYDRDEADREVVRHKSFASEEMTLDEAAWDMALLDYDFFLFVDLGTGEDSLIERNDDGELLVRRLTPGVKSTAPTATDYEESDATPPRLAVSEAIEMLNAANDSSLFFRNSATGRANLVYRRYDGHYGLVTPAVDEDT